MCGRRVHDFGGDGRQMSSPHRRRSPCHRVFGAGTSSVIALARDDGPGGLLSSVGAPSSAIWHLRPLELIAADNPVWDGPTTGCPLPQDCATGHKMSIGVQKTSMGQSDFGWICIKLGGPGTRTGPRSFERSRRAPEADGRTSVDSAFGCPQGLVSLRLPAPRQYGASHR